VVYRVRSSSWTLVALLPCALLACGGETKDHAGAGASGKTATAGSGGGGVAGTSAEGGRGATGASGGSSGGLGGSGGSSAAGKGGASAGTGALGGSSVGGSSGSAGRSGGASGGGTGGESGGVGGGGAGTGGDGAGMGAGGDTGLGCPTAPPGEGDPCSLQSSGGVADCTFGDDPRPSCRTGARCVQGKWQLTMPNAKCDQPPLPNACGTAPPTVGDTCSDAALECWYDDGTHCACSPCKGGSAYPNCQVIDPPEWACGTPDTGCPIPLPQAGEACDIPNLSCGPSCEEPIRCENGTWVYQEEMCPICASPDTPIATPEGERAIAELVPGDLVYSVDGRAVVAVPLLRVGSTPVTAHRVLRVELDDGRVLELSPGHPTADGRHFYDLRAGTPLDDRHVVVSSTLVPYRYERTYDILPASSTGTYFAAGALIGSTLTSAGTATAR